MVKLGHAGVGGGELGASGVEEMVPEEMVIVRGGGREREEREMVLSIARELGEVETRGRGGEDVDGEEVGEDEESQHLELQLECGIGSRWWLLQWFLGMVLSSHSYTLCSPPPCETIDDNAMV